MNQNKDELCRFCGKSGVIYCNINHQIIRSLINMIPNLIDFEDQSLPQEVCTTCYQMVKNQIIHNLSNILDTQEILKKILKTPAKNTNLEEILKKYGISVKKKEPVKTDEDFVQEIIVEEVFEDSESEFKETSNQTTQMEQDQEIVFEFFDEEEVSQQDSIKKDFSKIQSSPSTSKVSNKVIIFEKPGCYQCIKCRQIYKDYKLLEAHMKDSKNCKIVNYICAKCGHRFDSHKQLQAHKKSHKVLKQHECLQCQKIYSTEFNLENHKATAHCQIQPFESTYRCCNLKFKTKQELAAHVKNHSKTNFFCQICSKVLHSKYSLQIHSKSHASGTFHCKICQKSFNIKIQLERHMYLHKTYGIAAVEDKVDHQIT